jgi:hypothetical protein
MKNLILIFACFFGLTFAANSQDIVGLDSHAKQRADALSKKMAQDLQLNNFQQAKLQAINAEVLAKMVELEYKYKDDPIKQDEACRGVCVLRDQKLETVLSTDQYSEYFGSREDFYQYDRKKSKTANIGKQMANENN